jgi:hypothetical protein
MNSQKDDIENTGKNSMHLPKLVNVAHFRSKHFEPVLLLSLQNIRSILQSLELIDLHLLIWMAFTSPLLVLSPVPG